MGHIPVGIHLIVDLRYYLIGLIMVIIMLEYKSECILQAAHNMDIDYLLHGCNCMKTFGAGFAKKLKEKYPDANSADQKTEWTA